MAHAAIPTELATFEEALQKAQGVRYHGISEPVARVLYTSAQAVPRDEAIVEIGSFVGYSTIFLSMGSRAGQGARVHCLDAWGLPPSSAYSKDAYQEKLAITSETFEEFLGNMTRAGLEDLMVPHRAYSYAFSRSWPKAIRIGLLFIDGDHSEWGAYLDWFLYRPFLADGARVVFHDFGDPAVARAARRIEPDLIRDVQIVGTGYDGREALVFSYQRHERISWRATASYIELSLKRVCEPWLPIKTLRRVKRTMDEGLFGSTSGRT